MNKTIIKIILWSIVILWMAFIFSLSAQTATESSSLSSQVIRKAAQYILPDFKNMEITQQEILIEECQLIVRKTTHLLIYLVLGVFCITALFQHTLRNSQRFFTALTICIGYAASDEFHQLFVSGRSAQISDIIIDTLGALIGIVLLLWVYRRWNAPRSVNKQKVTKKKL